MSFVSADCLDNIIGLSQTPCDCFEVPEIASLSLSGLYLDKLEGLNLKLIEAGSDCEQGSMWDFMVNARASAIQQFRTYLNAGLTKEYKKRHVPFSGNIGESGFRRPLAVGGAYAGSSYYTKNIRGGSMKIKRIGVMFSQAGTFDIDIYNSLEDSLIYTVSVTAQARKITWIPVATPIFLPLANDTGDCIRYDFLYDTSTIPGEPMDAKVWCGCGGKANYYNEREPKFSANKWMNYVMSTGVYGDNIATPLERDVLHRGSLYNNGIILDVEFVCDVSDLLCQHVEDFDNGDLSMAIATCIRYMSGVFLLDYILGSGEINFYTMSDRERLMGKKNTYTKEFNNLLYNTIIPQYNIEGNDCLVCDNTNSPKKRGILS